MSQASTRWFNRYHRDYLSRSWEDEVFLFNPHTGHTHILNQLSADILQWCAVAPHTEKELIQALTQAAEVVDAEATAKEAGDHLWQLQQLGLLELAQT